MNNNINNWGSCGTCLGTTYTDQYGNATGDGNTYVGASVGSCAPVSGWMIAAIVGVMLLASSMKKGK